MKQTYGFGLGALLAWGAVACQAPDGTEKPTEALGERAQRIELHDWGQSFGFAFTATAPLQPGEELDALQARLRRRSFPTQATGAVIAPYLDAAGVPIVQHGSKVRFTCGATLVSPSYIVTAAHCVDPDSIKVLTDTVQLEMYRPTLQLAREEVWRPKTALTGSFPDYQHGSFGAEDGYHVDRYACTLVSRCGFGSVNCPSTATANDVALLRCEGRPGDRYGYLNVASSERQGAEVYVPWKHEVYDIAETEATTSDKFRHYVQYPSQYADNYHYLDRNQLLPLETIAWPDGTWPRKVTDVNQLTVWTDALGCHGTSGSGFLQEDVVTGAWELLGPTALGGTAFAGLLCQHLPGVGSQPTPLPGQQHLGYSSLIQTRTVMNGSSAAWALDCASQPLGSFTLGGRSGCSRAQSGLAFAARGSYSDLDPWRSPSVRLEAATTNIGSVQLEQGARYRVALGGTLRGSCNPGSGCPTVALRIGGTEVLRVALEGAVADTLLRGATFTATSSGSQSVSVVTPSGSLELGLVDVTPEVSRNSFDTGYERAEAALVVPGVSANRPMPMRFVGDGGQGFAALLYAGERLLLARQAVSLQGELSVRFASTAAESLTCGLVDRAGVVLASTACAPGALTSLSYEGAAVPSALFIDGPVAGDVQIDGVSVGFVPITGSPCADGTKNGAETDVDCGGAVCGLCGVGKACALATDCVSGLCTAGQCVAAPTCTDGTKNGTETDVDCGGSCPQDCAVGKTCSVAADCVSNLCTAGQCVAAPTCTDGTKNGTETDVDCGGSCPQDCAVGKTCSVAADCVSNTCTAGKCATPAPAGVTATLSFSSTWNVGYCANVTVMNRSAVAINGWTTVVNLAQSSVVSSWSAAFMTTGTTLTARSLSWNQQLAPNASTVFGFCANKTGSSWEPKVSSASTP